MTWKSVSEPPELFEDDWGILSSEDVFVFTEYGSRKIARFERWPDELESRWMTTCCSERWNITSSVLFWQPLPESPIQGEKE